ncbi:MAG TPA: discoidin domain-containing protein [Chitinivibrionales bacterium]|nr:discoidin domain-containing protein [Chitinivibrionales bacterium]
MHSVSKLFLKNASILFLSTMLAAAAVIPVSARPNLALSRTAKASSVQSADLAAANAVDGDYSTRWGSATADSQWLFVDFGEKDTVDSVFITWETAAAKDYYLQVWSSDIDTPAYNDIGWTSVAHVSDGVSGEKRSITFTPTPARYLRMRCMTRATTYGVSMYEFEAYGNTPACPIPAITKQPVNTIGIIGWPVPFRISALGLDLSYQWQRSDTKGALWADAAVGTGAAAAAYSFSPAASDSGAMFRCVVSSPCGIDTSRAAVLSVPSKKPARTNIALNTIAKSSAIQSGFFPGLSVDGTVSQASRWSSAGGDSSWIFVDLGAKYTIDSLAIYWEHAGAKKYSVQVWSSDVDTPAYNDNGWTMLLTDTTLYYQPPPADWCTSFLKVPPTAAQFVRIRCYQRLTNYGCSIFELEVYGTPVPVFAKGAPVDASPGREINVVYGTDGMRFLSNTGKISFIDIFSCQGKLVRHLTDAPFWDFRGQAGKTVKNGTYIARITCGDGIVMRTTKVCR